MRNQYYREPGSRVIWIVWAIQFVFLIISLAGVDGPFVSVHFERQNQTYDIARHIFQTGWPGILTPEASFSSAGYTALPFTVARLEFPFYGLFGWPFAAAFGHEHAVVRLIAVAFSLLSISLVFHILGHWLEPLSAVAGTFLWAFSPLVLHFGQVPMPDILCTAGLMLAFFLALRGQLWASSAAFAFAILAKESIIPFGLPVLTALLLAKKVHSVRSGVRLAVLWCAVPAVSLCCWLSLDFFGPRTPWTVLQTATDNTRGRLGDLLVSRFYVESAACIVPFGVGLLGMLALYFALTDGKGRMQRSLKLSIVFAAAFYWVVVVRKILEPQYFLPLVFWLVVAGSFGFAALWQRMGASRVARLGLFFLLMAHVAVAWRFTSDLKASRVPDYPAIETAARLIAPGARVAVVGRAYGAAPAVWLNRNVETVSDYPNDLAKDLPYLESMNFRYLLILDLESRHSRKLLQGTSASDLMRSLKFVITGDEAADADSRTHFCDPGSAIRQFCDGHLTRIYDNPDVVLYRLP